MITEEGTEELRKMRKADRKSTIWFWSGMSTVLCAAIAMFVIAVWLSNLVWFLIVIGVLTIFVIPFAQTRMAKWHRIAEAHAANAKILDLMGGTSGRSTQGPGHH